VVTYICAVVCFDVCGGCTCVVHVVVFLVLVGTVTPTEVVCGMITHAGVGCDVVSCNRCWSCLWCVNTCGCCVWCCNTCWSWVRGVNKKRFIKITKNNKIIKIFKSYAYSHHNKNNKIIKIIKNHSNCANWSFATVDYIIPTYYIPTYIPTYLPTYLPYLNLYKFV